MNMRSSTNYRKRFRLRRAGYLYVAVLFTSLAVSTMGLVALSVASLRTRITLDANDYTSAQILAKSGIEQAIQAVRSDNTWRTRFKNNVESSSTVLGQGSFTWKLVDSDNNLNDDDSDSVRLVGIGRVGRTTVAESVRMLATGQPLACLGSSLHCGGDIVVKSAVQFMTDQQISSGGNISASGFLSSIQGGVEAAGTATGTIQGNIVQNAAVRRMPGSSAFDYYLDNGTSIPIEALPAVNGIRTCEKQLLSPQVNPFGDRNSEGIYLIHCGGQRVCIKNSRIVGTLILIEPASNSSVEGSLRWDAAVANYPALLVMGDLEIKTSSLVLSETVLTVNFNPSSTPYQGKSDSDLLDSYPSEINGLVFISGQFKATQDFVESVFRGVTVCQTIDASSSSRFNYRNLIFDRPPPGFASGNPMVVSPGSRRREALP